MYRDRGSKAEVSSVDRRRVNGSLDKKLERSSPSTSRAVANNGKDKSAQSVMMGNIPTDHRKSRSASLSKTNRSDG